MAKDEQSPSGEKEGEDDDASMLNFVKTQVNKLFIDHIPVDSIKELPDHCKPTLSPLSHLSAVLPAFPAYQPLSDTHPSIY